LCDHWKVSVTGVDSAHLIVDDTSAAGFGPSRSPKPADGDHRNRSMAITENGHGDRRNRACRSPKTVMAIA
jgi:hypothetical protein